MIVKKEIYDAFMQGCRTAPSSSITATPIPATRWPRPRPSRTLDLFKDEGLFERVAELAPYWEDAAHSLKGLPHVIDIRTIGLVAGIELEPIAGKPGARAFEAFLRAYEKNVLIRTTGDTIALSPSVHHREERRSTSCSIPCATILKTLP